MTDQIKHTAGPWKVVEHSGEVSINAGPLYMTGASIYVEVCRVNRHDEETLPNANLLAAAPFMLDALQIAAEWMERFCIPDLVIEKNAGKSCLSHLREAIAKAEGRIK